jgi:peptide/nickel transport system substrate-binding protein
VPEKSLIAIAMQRGELDVAAIDAATWSFIGCSNGKSGALVLDKIAGARTVYLGFNVRRKPLDDARIRRAIAQSVDHEQIAAKFYSGMAVVSDTDFTPGSWAYNEHVRKCRYNPKESEGLFSSVGYILVGGRWEKNGKPLAFRLVTVRDLQDIAQVVADQLARNGVACEVQVLEYSTLRSRYLRTGDFDAVLWSRSSGPDPECTLVWKSGGALNFSGFSDPRVDRLLDHARTTTTRSARAAQYRAVQQILAEQLPWIFLVQPKLLLIHNQRVMSVSDDKQVVHGLPWDNPVFNAAHWKLKDSGGDR